MALLAFATFAASVASAQSTYVLYGNVGEGEVKLSTTRDKASDGTMIVSDYSENGQVVGFTQTITEHGNWFLSYDWFGSEIDPVILKGTEYNLVYDVRTSWSGDVKLKFEVQTKGATEKPVSFDHDGEWHTITIPVQSWVDANVLQAIESSSRVMFGFVGGNWNVKEPTTIDYRNVKLVPVNVVPDTEAPAWVSDPTAAANSTSATISVNANDNVSTTLTYEVSKTADFATLEATVNGKANETTEIALKGLSPETDYTYYVRVKDMAGNVSAEVKTVTFTTTAQAAVVATYYGVFYANDWEEKATVDGKEVAPQINWKAETLEGYNDVIVTAELSEALPDGEALKFCAFIEGGVGQVDNKDMTATGKANEYTIKLSEVLPEGKTLEKDQIFSQFFFRIYPKKGGVSRTKILATYKVGASNDPIATDTKAPEWGVDPVAQNVTDKAAEIVVNVTDDSGSAVITLTGDNGFAELKKTVKADGTDQTIALNGLTANTTYNLTLAIADAAGNAGESRTVNFTTLETPEREVLYHSFDFTSENWTKHGETNSFAPNGRLLLTVNADNTVTFKVTVDEGAETVDNAWVILHGIENFRINAQEDGSFVGTSTNSISNRDASQIFHLNFVLKNGVGNSELYRDGMSFKPSEGSISAVAEVETEAAKVVAANGVIRVEGDKTFAVYTVAGQLAFRGMGEVRLDKGVYVVVVDGKAQKVML